MTTKMQRHRSEHQSKNIVLLFRLLTKFRDLIAFLFYFFLFFRLHWKWAGDKDDTVTLQSVNSVLILEGVNSLHFIDQTILKGKVAICSLLPHKVSVYHFAEQNLAVIVSEEMDLNLFGSITELLQPFVSNVDQKVFTVNFQASAMHKGTLAEDRDRYCFIRSINSKISGIVELAEPNLFTGVTAGGKQHQLRTEVLV